MEYKRLLILKVVHWLLQYLTQYRMNLTSLSAAPLGADALYQRWQLRIYNGLSLRQPKGHKGNQLGLVPDALPASCFGRPPEVPFYPWGL